MIWRMNKAKCGRFLCGGWDIRKVTRLFLTILAAAGLGAGLLSCTTTDAVTGKNVYNLYSLQDDVKLGQQAMQSNIEELRKKGVPLNRDTAQVAKLNQMMQRITAVSDMPGLPYEVTLIHTNIVNAAAMPGGQMMVFEGLYDSKEGLVRSDDEMAAVLAHEVAHVTCRHATERLSGMLTASLITEGLAMVAEHNDQEDLATGIRAVYAIGTPFLIPMYSRQDEFEADRVGLMYMARAGYDPRTAPRIWERVAEKPGGQNKASIFATHPSSYDRYHALYEQMPQAMAEYERVKGLAPTGVPPKPPGRP